MKFITEEKTVCEKVVFNHAKFKEITKCNSKDLTDYAYQFEDFRTFRDTFERFILEADVKKDDYFIKHLQLRKNLSKCMYI